MSGADTTKVQLPRWQSHKKVRADLIAGVNTVDGAPRWILKCGAIIAVSPTLEGRVPAGIFPVGGYYVRYEDGFESWSPAEAFRDGYTLLPAGPGAGYDPDTDDPRLASRG